MACSGRRRERLWMSVLFRANTLLALSLSLSFVPYVLTHKNTLALQTLSASVPPRVWFSIPPFHFLFSPLVKDEATSRAWHFNWSSRESTFFLSAAAVWFAAKTCWWPEEKDFCCCARSRESHWRKKSQMRERIKGEFSWRRHFVCSVQLLSFEISWRESRGAKAGNRENALEMLLGKSSESFFGWDAKRHSHPEVLSSLFCLEMWCFHASICLRECELASVSVCFTTKTSHRCSRGCLVSRLPSAPVRFLCIQNESSACLFA